MATVNPVLTKFRAALDKRYGDRIERIVLYGSRARGDVRALIPIMTWRFS